MKFTLKRPCADCPFRTSALPGWLGGHEPEEIMQAVFGNEMWTCHQTVDEFMTFEAARANPVVQHCYGAAMFMRRMCKLPRDAEIAAFVQTVDMSVEDVFPNPQAFLDYHTPGD